VIAYVVGRVDFTEYLDVHYVPGTGEILSSARPDRRGLGFLWYNAPPAAVFMGDTGSLALGGALGAIAVCTKHEIVLAIVGGLFVVEALSVIIQVLYFKRTGKRVFLMAPIHHHFEKKGWAEPQIVIRFWIISLILALIGLATLKVRYARGRWRDIAALVVSPGIPHLYPAPNRVIARAMAAGVPVDNDIGLFFRSFATDDWDGLRHRAAGRRVTGSNGKSTTSALIHHILTAAGRREPAGGQHRARRARHRPARARRGRGAGAVSYQTDLARALTPDIAVFTNLSPDHLDRHGGMGGYFAAKRRLFAEGGPDRAVIGVDEPEGRYLANQLGEGPRTTG
jgi:hypothetical protein